ncbi:MAG: VanZ family protein [Pseudomonadota bacterium]|jgi:uncharacterized protein YfiM (DUF2279 family)|nr:VanZ family protein [Pseudomonadota bacterium]
MFDPNTPVAGRPVLVERCIRLVFWLAVAVVVFFALAPGGPAVSASMHDKVQHVVAFAGLGALATWSRALPSMWLGLAFLVALGGAIELLQGVTPERTPSWSDFAADLVGLALAYPIARLGVWGWALVRRTA